MALASAVVLAATFLPWFGLTPSGSAQTLGATILDPGYGGWRVLVPMVAVAAMVVGIANALLRPADRGALAVFVVLRALVVTQAGLVVAALATKAPHTLAQGAGSLVVLRWPAWGAVAASLVALGGSLAGASVRP